MNKTLITAGTITAYIATIVAANTLTEHFGLVPIGFGLLVTAGTFAAGAALVLRDAVQVAAGRWIALAAIAVGVGVSYLVASPALALASGIAFAASELVDMGVFTPLRPRNIYLAVLAASVVASPVDTVLFLHIAGFPFTWQAVLGQWIVKTGMAFLALGVIAVYKQTRPADERENTHEYAVNQ